MSEHQKFILDYLSKVTWSNGWVSPSSIGRKWKEGCHSSWASPKCKKLVTLGFVERDKGGWYRITDAGREALKETQS